MLDWGGIQVLWSTVEVGIGAEGAGGTHGADVVDGPGRVKKFAIRGLFWKRWAKNSGVGGGTALGVVEGGTLLRSSSIAAIFEVGAWGAAEGPAPVAVTA